jgi:hypothetical protein
MDSNLWCPRLTTAMILSGSAFQRKGFGCPSSPLDPLPNRGYDSASNADLQAGSHEVRDSGGTFLASAGSSSKPSATPPSFHFVSLR